MGAQAQIHKPRPRWRRWRNWLLALPLLFAAASVLQVLALRFVDPPFTTTMALRYAEAWVEGDWGFRLHYQWRDLDQIAPSVPISLVAAEDQRFPLHRGFDLQAIERARDHNARGGRLRGASTISQQVSKNLFLWQGRSYLRKGLEAWYTVLIELLWPKSRIIEVYRQHRRVRRRRVRRAGGRAALLGHGRCPALAGTGRAPGCGAAGAAPLRRAQPRPLRAAARGVDPAPGAPVGRPGLPGPVMRHGWPCRRRLQYHRRMSDLLTVVIAACNEADSLPRLHPRILNALDQVPGLHARLLYVDDGSSDGTWAILQALVAADARVGAIRLSRNFGKELALTAGLDQVEAGAVLLLDADGQDPPELIPAFVALWREGYDNVFGTRRIRAGESWLKRTAAAAFYRVIGRLSRTPIPADTGDFRLLSPRARAALQQLRERHRFMKGLFGWVGFRQVALPYDREPRLAGRSKFTLWKLWNFALEGITSFQRAVAGGHLPGPVHCAVRLCVRGVGHPQGGAVGRPGRRLADHDGGDPVPRRHPADRPGHDRRILGPALRRGQAAAVVPCRHPHRRRWRILRPLVQAGSRPCLRCGNCWR